MFIRIRSPHKGFTLPELLLMTALLGFILSAVLASFIHCIRLNDSSRNLTVAVSHANYIMESIKGTTFSNIATNISGGTWNWNATQVGTQGLTALNRETTTVTSSGSTLLDVTVTVTWQDASKRSRSASLRSYFTG